MQTTTPKQREFTMDHPDPRFNDSLFAVNATEFERQTLQEQYKGRIQWVEDPNSLIVQIGKLASMELVYVFNWATINNVRVMFYRCSGVMDAKILVEAFIREIGPEQFIEAIEFHKVILGVTDGKGL